MYILLRKQCRSRSTGWSGSTWFPLCMSIGYTWLGLIYNDGFLFSALQKLRGYHDVNDEIEEMRIEARKASSVQTFTLKQLLTTPELKLPIIIACVSQVAQQWSGINAVSSLLGQFQNIGTYCVSEQWWLRRVCTYVQTRLCLCCSHTWSMDVY